MTAGRISATMSDLSLGVQSPHLAGQMSRNLSGAPKLRINRQPSSIFDYRIENFDMLDYAPQAHISAPVAV